MANKMTNAKALEYVLTNCSLPDDVREKVEKIEASYAKKTGSDKLSPEQEKARAIGERIYETMEADVEYTVSDIIRTVPECAGMTPQKVAPMMNRLATEGRVTQTKGRATTYRKN